MRGEENVDTAIVTNKTKRERIKKSVFVCFSCVYEGGGGVC